MKKIISIVLSAVIISAVFCTVKFALFQRLYRNAEFGVSRIINDDKINTLFIGSSMFRQGVNTADLCLGDSVFTLCYNGNQPWMENLTVNYLNQNNKKLDTLVVDMYAYSMGSSKTKISDNRFLMEMPAGSIYGTYNILTEHGDAGLKELYEMFVTSNNELLVTWPITYPLINARYEKGNATTYTSGSSKENLEKEAYPINKTGVLDEFQLENMKQLIELCNSNGTKVVFLETPKYERLYEDPTYMILMNQYFDFLEDKDCTVIASKRTVSELKADTGISLTAYDYDSTNPDYFVDLIHLSYNGRKELSVILNSIFASLI